MYAPGGLFYSLFRDTEGAIIDGIVLSDSRITANDESGGIVGKTFQNSIVNNCHVRSNVLIHNIYNFEVHSQGGVVGTNGAGCQVTNCTSAVTITGRTGSSSRSIIGGIAGENNGIVSNNIAFDVTIGI